MPASHFRDGIQMVSGLFHMFKPQIRIFISKLVFVQAKIGLSFLCLSSRQFSKSEEPPAEMFFHLSHTWTQAGEQKVLTKEEKETRDVQNKPNAIILHYRPQLVMHQTQDVLFKGDLSVPERGMLGDWMCSTKLFCAVSAFLGTFVHKRSWVQEFNLSRKQLLIGLKVKCQQPFEDSLKLSSIFFNHSLHGKRAKLKPVC